MTAQTSRPENTRNRPEKNQQGWAPPSFEISRWEKFPCTYWTWCTYLKPSSLPCWAFCLFLLWHRCWCSLLQILDVKVPLDASRYRPRANAPPAVQPAEIPVAWTEAGVCYNPKLCFSHSLYYHLGRVALPTRKALPECRTWNLGKHECASRTSICSALPIPQRSGQRGEAHMLAYCKIVL